jgi:hypothetical protein
VSQKARAFTRVSTKGQNVEGSTALVKWIDAFVFESSNRIHNEFTSLRFYLLSHFLIIMNEFGSREIVMRHDLAIIRSERIQQTMKQG